MNGSIVGSPYRGLVPFSEDDAPFFFGRESQKRLVVANMMSEPLTILYGPSGVGKTSFLRAGVLRHLHELASRRADEGGAPELAALIFRDWRDEPVASLRDAVIHAVGEALDGAPAVSPPDGLAETASWGAEAVGGSLYVILDQFEDYFLYSPWDEGPGSFLDEFSRAVGSAGSRAGYLLSVREDAVAQLDRFKRRIPSILENYLRLDHLDVEQAREAIERPLHVFNEMQPDTPVHVEPELVEEVLESVGTGSLVPDAGTGPESDGRLRRFEAPFLQLVLQRIWQEEVAVGSPALRLSTLRELGGAARIVRFTLAAGIAALTSHEQELAQEALRYLITPSGGSIAQSAADLADYLQRDEGEVVDVLERLAAGDVRILRATANSRGETQYELFSDLLAAPLNDWSRERRVEHEVRRREEAEVREAERETEVRRLRLAVRLLAGLVILLLVSLVVVLLMR